MKRLLYFFTILNLPLLFGCRGPASDQSEWQNYQSNNFGISLDCPYQIRFNSLKIGHTQILSGTTRREPWDLITSFLHIFTEKKNEEYFYILIHSEVSENQKDFHYDSENLISHYTNGLNKMNLGLLKPTSWDQRLVQCSGMPATLISQDMTLSNALTKSTVNNYRSVLFVTQKNKYWRIGFFHNNQEKFEPTVDRIIKSIKIEP